MRAARSRRVPAALLLAPALFLGALCFAAPATAQVTTVETVPPEIDDEGRTTSERVDQIVLTLRVVAVLVLAAAGVYWWQTRPDRVVRAAVARGELERATALVEEDVGEGELRSDPVDEVVEESEEESDDGSDGTTGEAPETEDGHEERQANGSAAPSGGAPTRGRSSAEVLADVAATIGDRLAP